MHRRQLRFERVAATAGDALMVVCALGWGGCERAVVDGGVCEGRAEAVVRAENSIEAAGAASLAPSLARMEQLTELGLSRMLRASAAAAL